MFPFCYYRPDTDTERVVRFTVPQKFTFPTGEEIIILTAQWERAHPSVRDRLWLTEDTGQEYLLEADDPVPDWLALTAPVWCDRVAHHRKALG